MADLLLDVTLHVNMSIHVAAAEEAGVDTGSYSE